MEQAVDLDGRLASWLYPVGLRSIIEQGYIQCRQCLQRAD